LRRDVRQQRARDQLIALGLGHRLHHLPAEMSAGEQQRTGLARALVTDPLLLLADEPTGNLDSGSSSEVFELLRSQVAAGRSVLMATHDLGAVPYASRVIRMSDGRVVADE
jgi:putative ABC transport system ATP-binding protein